jgi:hypothetical protein
MSHAEYEEWGPEERRMFAQLPSEAAVTRELEDEVVRALHARRWFAAPRALHARRWFAAPRALRSPALPWALAATAASFVIGVYVGRASSDNLAGERNDTPAVATASDSTFVTVTHVIAK